MNYPKGAFTYSVYEEELGMGYITLILFGVTGYMFIVSGYIKWPSLLIQVFLMSLTAIILTQPILVLVKVFEISLPRYSEFLVLAFALVLGYPFTARVLAFLDRHRSTLSKKGEVNFDNIFKIFFGLFMITTFLMVIIH